MNSGPAKRLAEAYVEQAEEALAEGEQSRAESLLRRALAADPRNARARELRNRDASSPVGTVQTPTAKAVPPPSARVATASPSFPPTLNRTAGAQAGSTFASRLGLSTVAGAALATAIAIAVAVGFYVNSPGTDDTSAASPCSIEVSSIQVVEASVLVATGTGYGTAFHIGDGVFITAAHVVLDGGKVVLESELMQSDASVTFIDPQSDIAELHSRSGAALPSLAWSPREAIPPGLTVATVGYPVDVEGTGSLSRGVISRLFSESGLNLIQTDVPVNPGNSGGALVDECGDVLGVVVAKWNDAGIEGIAYAVAAQSARRSLEEAR